MIPVLVTVEFVVGICNFFLVFVFTVKQTVQHNICRYVCEGL